MQPYRNYTPAHSPITGMINALAIQVFIGVLVWASYFVLKGCF